MYRQITLLLGAALLGLAHAQHPQMTAPLGPQPTAAPWIGVNTEYLTDEIHTTTIDNAETTTTVRQQLAVTTATEASDGVNVGDITVLMSDSIQDGLDALIKEAVASCGAVAKFKKRDAASCMIDTLQGAAQNDEALALVNPAEWDGFALELAETAPEILAAAVQVFKTQAQKNKFAVMLAAAATAGALAVSEPAAEIAEVAHKLVFGDGLFGHAAEDEDEPSPSTSACDPSATADENSPACDDSDCEGKEKVCQKEGEKKDCPCVNWTKIMVAGLFDREWADAQQNILRELEAELPDVIPPQCFRNTFGDDFDGKPKAEPSAFCHCSSKGEDKMTKGNFATMSGDGDNACTYSTMPTETISITKKPRETGVKVTSCRRESSSGGDPYCTCNDNSMHGDIVTTYEGKETTVCPDAIATEASTPTGEPSCYPTYGPPHDDPSQDQLIRLCRAEEEEFNRICQSKDMLSDRGERVACPGKDQVPSRGSANDRPIANNFQMAKFEKADDAADDCNYLFYQNGFDIDADSRREVEVQVDALCIPMFEAIRDKCSWNGGEVKNQCGTFKYQTCSNGRAKDCQWGTPAR